MHRLDNFRALILPLHHGFYCIALNVPPGTMAEVPQGRPSPPLPDQIRIRYFSTTSRSSTIPRPGAWGSGIRPSVISGSGQTRSRRNGLSNTKGEMNSNIGAAGQAA